MLLCRNCKPASRIRTLLAVVLFASAQWHTSAAHAAAQDDPELRDIVAAAIASADCFADKYDSEVWYKMMGPRLRRSVKDEGERLQILKSVFCEAHRSGEQRLAPGLVLAMVEVESRFDRYAVSSAGAVGLMQVMPFWPAKLGMERHLLTKVEPNLRMGCAILRYYLRVEKGDVRKALARYNGSVGRNTYPDKIVQSWTSRWNGADDLGLTARRQP